MRTQHRQSIAWRALHSLASHRWISIAGVVVLALIAYPMWQKMEHKQAIEREVAALEAEAERIAAANKELEDMIEYLQGDAFAEREARLRLNMKKPGEQVVVVQGNEGVVAGEQEVESVFRVRGLEKDPVQETVPNRMRWWQYFFNAAHR